MSSADLVAQLRAASDPLHVLAADALVANDAQVKRLRERIVQLEAIARLNAETIRSMQQAALEAASAECARTRRR